MNRLLLSLAVIGFILFLATPAAVAQELTPEDYVQYFKPLVGSWKTTTETDGKVIPGSFRLRVSQNGQCFIGYHEGGFLPSVQTIDGYDPATKKYITAEFNPELGFVLVTYECANVKPGKTLGEEVIGKCEVRAAGKDGKPSITTYIMKCTKVDEKMVVLVWADGKSNGNPVPDIKLTLERQPDRQRRPRQ